MCTAQYAAFAEWIDQGEFEKALGYFDHSARIYKELGDTLSEAAQIVKQGHVRRAQKEYDTAVDLYQDALQQYRSLKYPIGEGNTELDIGQLYSEKQEWEESIKSYNRAKEIFAKVGHKEKETLSLVLIGQAELSIPEDPAIVHLGFLPDQEKWDALAACDLLFMPSQFESLSMVILEAWWAQRPVLVNARCPVLRGQCRRSNGGLYYATHDEFVETLALLEERPPGRWTIP